MSGSGRCRYFDEGAPSRRSFLNSKLFYCQLRELFCLPNAALSQLNNLLGDDLGNGIVAVYQAELSERVLVSVGRQFDLLRAQRRVLQ